MTYYRKKELEFDVFNYVKNTNMFQGKVYVQINKLFTQDMLVVLFKSKLPKGTRYNADYFVFENIDICMKSICEMYKSLQNIKKYQDYSTLCLSMLQQE